MELDNHWFMTAGLVTSSVIAVVTNLFLLLVFVRRRSLRTVPNRFIINLLLTNLLSSVLLIPLLILDQRFYRAASAPTNNTLKLIFEEEIITNTNLEIIESKITESLHLNNNTFNKNILCYFAQSSINFMCTLSILSILLIGVNQYFGVLHSLRYHFYINKCRSMVSILLTWLVALVFCLLNIFTFNNKNWCFCHVIEPQTDSVRVFNTIYAFSYFTAIILAPFVAICVIYVCIYTAAHQNSERMRQSGNLDENPALPKTPSEASISKVPQSEQRNLLKTIKCKLSNSLFRYREETRAAKISILVIFLVLFCYLPYGITLVLDSQLMQPARFYNYLSLILLVVSNVMSPFLFAYRNARVKREVAKIFGLVSAEQQTLVKRPNDNFLVPEVVVTCKDMDRKSILKRVCDTTSHWTSKKCNFIAVPNECITAEARGSFSSASTQISTEE